LPAGCALSWPSGWLAEPVTHRFDAGPGVRLSQPPSCRPAVAPAVSCPRQRPMAPPRS
jgi:hypothetical protein